MLPRSRRLLLDENPVRFFTVFSAVFGTPLRSLGFPSKTKEGVYNAQAYFICHRLAANVRRILRRYAPSVFAARLFRPGTNQAGRQGSGRLAKAGRRQLARPPRLSLRT